MINRTLDRSPSHTPGLPRPLRLVLLAASALPDDRAVVDRAIAAAAREHAELVALHVLPADHGALIDGDGPVPPELDRIVIRARAAGVEAHSVVRSGDLGTEILRAARSLNADLVVMGTGTACGHVLNHCDRPTLVVRPWAEVDPGWDEPLPRVRAVWPDAGQPTASLPVAWSSVVEDAQHRLPITDDRVACRLLGEVTLERCVECDHLVRLEFAAGSSSPRHVVCRDRGSDLDDDLSW